MNSPSPFARSPALPPSHFVRQAFERAHDSYNKNAKIQRVMARRLIELLAAVRTDFDAALELGVGTGLTTDELCRQARWKSLRLCDFQRTAAQTTRRFPGAVFERRDLNDLTSPENDANFNEKSVFGDVDLVLSGATFQWIERLPELFDAISEALAARRGILSFSTFAPGHFEEIREAAGVSLHYHSKFELSTMLTDREFEILRCEESCEREFFAHPLDILRSLKQTGVNRIEAQTPQNPRRFLQDFCNKYKRFQTSTGLYSLTWRPLYFVARRF